MEGAGLHFRIDMPAYDRMMAARTGSAHAQRLAAESTAMPSPVVQLKEVTKRFGRETIVEGLDLEVNAGEFLTLLGPSGCGKTTILRLIAGFETPDGGEVFLGGRRVTDLPPNRRDVNTIFQNYALFPHLTVYDNVAFGPRIRKVPPVQMDRQVRDLLDLVKLTGLEGRPIHQLSGGQQQRVAIARALVNAPLVLLLDEPLSALDYQLRKEMQLELKRLHRKLGITFIFVTHDQEEAIFMSDRIAVIHEGRIQQLGSPKEIYEEPVNLFVARFVGQINVFEGEVLACDGPRMTARVAGVVFHLANRRDFRSGQRIKVLLRPEDLTAIPLETAGQRPVLAATIEEQIYKGTTVDLIVKLAGGQSLLVTEFFNEDAEEIAHTPGEAVGITWIDGWEVVLPDE
jgi:spermidine/putrescine transport system ATP-binding protein